MLLELWTGISLKRDYLSFFMILVLAAFAHLFVAFTVVCVEYFNAIRPPFHFLHFIYYIFYILHFLHFDKGSLQLVVVL